MTRTPPVMTQSLPIEDGPHRLAAHEIRENRPSHYYDLPKSEIQVSEEEALFDRLLDDIEADAFWMLEAMRQGWTLAEIKRDGVRPWIKRDLSGASA